MYLEFVIPRRSLRQKQKRRACRGADSCSYDSPFEKENTDRSFLLKSLKKIRWTMKEITVRQNSRIPHPLQSDYEEWVEVELL